MTPTPQWALPRHFLAAVLLAALPASAQVITNPSFSSNNFTTSPGYANLNGGVITGWTLSNPNFIGQNHSATASPFMNNGQIPTGPNVLFIQAGASAGSNNVKTTITGLTPGVKYNVSFRVNARYQGTTNLPNLVFSTDGTGPTVAAEVTNVATALNTTPWKYVGFEFTATNASHEITIANTKTVGDHTLLVDDVTIAPSTGAWSFAPWTGDADSGIDSQYVYTHAHSFGGGAWVSTKINGVDFDIGDSPGSNRFAIADLGNIFSNRTPNNVTGVSGSLAKDFRYGGPNPSITLQNLKPNTQYVFTLYGIGFDATGSQRSATFSSSLNSEKYTVNLTHYGQGNGLKVNYAYTTDALGSPVVINYPNHGPGSFHTSGFTNREAVASAPAPVWTSHAWSDDSTSGISSNHPYTHAFKFGAATNFNVNGVNFTGIAGANPAGTGYTSSNLPSFYNNDPNSVTGYGAPLAKDFVYGGYPETHTLSGLTPGQAYVFTLYSVGWDDGTRRVALIGGTGEGSSVLNQDSGGGNNQGVCFEYHYTASAAGTATITASGIDVATTTPFDRKSMHVYGISNRAADPYVAKAPEFTLQPTGATIGIGSSVTLHGETVGSPNMTYQWKKGVTDVSGATTPVLVLNDVSGVDAGSYTLVVTNGSGTTTSNPAVVSVLENIPGYSGSGIGLDGNVLAGGQVDPHYKLIVNPDGPTDTVYVQTGLPGSWLANSPTSQWIGPRANSSGAAGAGSDAGAGAGVYVYRRSLDLTGFDLSTVAISGKWATDNAGVEIRVNGTPVGFPNTTGVTFGNYVNFTITNTAFPGLLTTGVNTIDFVVRNEDAVSGFTGLRIDQFAAIGSIPPGTAPHIAEQPVGGNGPHNGALTLAVAASGSSPVTYQWYKGVTPIVDATSPVLQILVDDATVAGNYKVRVTNNVTSVDSNVAAVTVNNSNPTTEFDAATTPKDVPLQIDVADLLSNDSDADGDVVAFTSVSATSSHGGTVAQADGVITYTPPAGYTGSDTFTYTVNDGIWGGTTVESVLVTVTAPSASAPTNINIAFVSGDIVGTFTGAPGATYILQRSTTLAAGSWTDVDTKIAPPSGSVSVTDGDPPAGKAFYRISYTP
ncbi:cadherin-like domain-containing protein [Haloferula sp. BvORR071]|uniref:cadherin-like domain-containing protein n=1 Tax=Haloferula sp. BvORR071 TaxID=1396141 RepID=UPI002240F4E1|nr:cadherin-like domain-containing protein [Haloferula sp. BvORR071]